MNSSSLNFYGSLVVFVVVVPLAHIHRTPYTRHTTHTTPRPIPPTQNSLETDFHSADCLLVPVGASEEAASYQKGIALQVRTSVALALALAWVVVRRCGHAMVCEADGVV